MKRRLLLLVVLAVLLAAEALWLLPDLRAAQSPEKPAAPPDAPAEPTPPADPMAAMRRLPERPAPPAVAPAGWYSPLAADSGDIERLPPAVLGEAADNSYGASVSADGRYTAFTSYTGNLATGDMDGLPDVFVYDRQTGQTEMISVDNYGDNVFGYFYNPSISDDGRYVAFSGWTYSLVDEYDYEWRSDIYVHDRQTGMNTRVSVKSNGAHANGDSFNPYLSADGNTVVFESYANNLVTGDSNGVNDVFLHNRTTGVTSRVSVKATNTQANDGSFGASISADGRYVAFGSYATNLVNGDTNGVADVFVRDVTAKTTARASVGGGAAQGNDWSGDGVISDNGRYVAFASGATNLTPDDGDTSSDVFIRDRQANTTTLVSRDAAGNPSQGWAQWPSLSANGSLVAFDDYADLTPGGNNRQNVYVRNWQTGTIVRASVDGSGTPAEGAYNGVLSADGASVAFDSYGPLLSGDTNGADDVYLRRLNVNQTLRASAVAFVYTEPNGHSAYPAPSLDGRYVAYASYAGNIVPGDQYLYADVFVTDRQTDVTTVVTTGQGFVMGGALEKTDISDNGRYVAFAGDSPYVEGDDNGRIDTFVRDRQTNVTTLVSVNSAGEQGNYESWNPSLSGDGNLVAFVSGADNLVPNDNNGIVDAFVRNRTTGVTTRVSLTAAGAEATWDTSQIDIAAAGRFVAMSTYAALTPNDDNGYDDVYVRDLQTGALELISRAYDGSGANGSANFAVISGDGRYVAFESWAGNLVADDFNGSTTDIFLYDRQTGQMTLVSRGYDGAGAGSASMRPSISHDGRYVSFSSYAGNLVADDYGYHEDVFVYDRVTGVISRASVNADGQEGNNTSGGAALSGDGSKVAFGSYADNFVPGDTYGFKDVYITDRPTGGGGGGDAHNVYFISPSGNGNVGGIAFTGADILRYTRSSNTWQMVYDGSARGTAKNVGAFDLLADGRVLLVFSVNQNVPGLGTATPRDVVLFEPFDPLSYPLGPGTYAWYMRGASSGLTTTAESIDALYWNYNGIDLAPELTISTKGAAAVGPNGSLKAQDEDGIVCTLFNGVCTWKPALTLNLTTIPGMAAENVTGLARGFVNSNTYVTLAGPFNVGGVSGNAKSILRLTPAGAGWNVAAINWLAPGATFPSNLDGLSLNPANDPYP
jgi:hypothetical protein